MRGAGVENSFALIFALPITTTAEGSETPSLLEQKFQKLSSTLYTHTEKKW